ncbi:MAG: IclR family transcriptional regulator [Acidimicrobiia bacterium]|nr:IclR family transcriptional regulator [Acidimicrobiia bacterium]
MRKPVPATSGVGVVDKSVGLLDALAKGPASLAELVESTGLSRPTAHRLARAWEHHGVVGRDEQGRFRLGAHATAWAGASGTGPLLDAARSVLADLRDATDESAQLYMRDGDRRICVAAAERPSGLRDTVPVGASLPLDAGSGGKVMLAFEGPPADAERRRIRKRGWADSVAEREPGVASVSAPVLRDDTLVAVVSVSGPIDRLTCTPGKRFAQAVTRAARDLEHRAGL